jgi:hypothetical protein
VLGIFFIRHDIIRVMNSLRSWFDAHKTFVLAIGFLVVFSVSVSYAVPPTSPYAPGATLDPQCAPGSSNCTVTASAGGGGISTDGVILAIDTDGANTPVPDLGGGTRLMWYPSVGAFRAGSVVADEWNSTNIGQSSVAFGDSNTASGTSSMAFGAVNTASGPWSLAGGFLSTASGNYSIALGNGATAISDNSVALGQLSNASGQNATALNGGQATGISSFAIGSPSFASGNYSFSFNGTASGGGAIALGNNSVASGLFSFATSFNTASGRSSTAFGNNTIADSMNSTAFGQFNIGGGTADTWIGTESLFEIGNGTDNSTRSNALTVLKNGNTTIGGDLQAAGLLTGGNLNILGTSDTIASPANLVGEIVYDDAYEYVANNHTYNYRVYAYKIVNGERIYSAGYATLSDDLVDDFSGNHNGVALSWNEVPGADGYRILLKTNQPALAEATLLDQFMAYALAGTNYNYGYDTANNSFVDGDPSVRFTNDKQTVTPTSAYNNNNTVNGAMSVNGPVAVSGAVSITGNTNLEGMIIATGTGDVNEPSPDLGGGVRMMWIPSKAAFRAGLVYDTQWDNANIGGGSTAFGQNTTASGDYSTAFGAATTASGDMSTAFGQGTVTDSYGSFALGQYNIGGGTADTWIDTDSLFEIGNGVNANNRANALTILKNGNTSIGGDLHVAGNLSCGGTCGGISSQWENESSSVGNGIRYANNVVIGGPPNSNYGFGGTTTGSLTVGGLSTLWAGNFVNALIVGNTNSFANTSGANAFYTTVFGSGNTINVTATSFGMYVFGQNNTISGSNSFAFGANNNSSALSSMAFGIGTTASGDYSTTFGSATIADSYGSFALGQDNVGGGDPYNWVDTDSLFEIGNGVGGFKSNALTVLKNGNVGINTPTPGTLLSVGSATYDSSLNGGIIAHFENDAGTCDLDPTNTGGIVCTSDMNAKKNITILADNSPWSFNVNITPDNTSIFAKIIALTPVQYNFNTESDNEIKHTGFIAQEVEQVFPDLVNTNAQGRKSMNYVGLVPYAIQAIQDMNFNITKLDDIGRPNTWRESLIAWLGSANNGITNLFSKQVTTPTLCVGTNEDRTCITKAELDALLHKPTDPMQPAPVITTPDITPVIDTEPAPDAPKEEVKEDTVPAEEKPSEEPKQNTEAPAEPAVSATEPAG